MALIKKRKYLDYDELARIAKGEKTAYHCCGLYGVSEKNRLEKIPRNCR